MHDDSEDKYQCNNENSNNGCNKLFLRAYYAQGIWLYVVLQKVELTDEATEAQKEVNYGATQPQSDRTKWMVD